MKKHLKRVVALLCCLVMTASLVPCVSAANTKKVLFLGSDITEDTIFYLADLAHLTGQNLEIALAEQESADLRVLAASCIKTELTYKKANASTGYKLKEHGTISIPAALKEQPWDVVVLQNGLLQSAIRGMYSSDLKYLTDMVEDLCPNAQLYWNMPWAVDDDSDLAEFRDFFEKDRAALYNNLLACTKQFIALNPSFDGILYTGAAIENARAVLGEKMLRNGKNLSFRQGRLIAALTALKTLFPDANLNKIGTAALKKILTDDDESQKDTYENSEKNLALIKSAVDAACAGEPAAVKDDHPLRTVSDESLFTVVQNVLPYQYEIPEVTVMDNGDIYVSAYENVLHTPVLAKDSYELNFPATGSDVRVESGGIFVFFKSTDGGKTFEKLPFVVNDAQMEAWGLVSLSDRYQKLKENPNYNYTYYFDPRDPDIKSFHIDVNGDGQKENILFLTFWVRSFMRTGKSTFGETYCTYSADGGKTWVKPVPFAAGVKCGDITEFADGTLLMPTYSGGCANGTYITIDEKGALHYSSACSIKDGKWDGEAADGMETSFIAPNGGDTVFALIRSAGVVMRSEDRGKTWTLIYNIENNIAQPGFTQIDENRVFATWSVGSPREAMGKVFYIDGAWNDSGENLLYGVQHAIGSPRDVGDPSCTMLPDGRVLITCYDSYYHSVIGTIQNPDDPVYARTSVSSAFRAVPKSGTAYVSRQSVTLDGVPTEFDMYKIIGADGGETNFIKLRDIASLLNGTAAQFNIKFNTVNNSIALIPKKAYTPDGSEMSTPFSGERAYQACSAVIKLNGEIPALAGITLTDDNGGDYNYFKLRDLGAILGFKVDWSAERGIFIDTK